MQRRKHESGYVWGVPRLRGRAARGGTCLRARRPLRRHRAGRGRGLPLCGAQRLGRGGALAHGHDLRGRGGLAEPGAAGGRGWGAPVMSAEHPDMTDVEQILAVDPDIAMRLGLVGHPMVVKVHEYLERGYRIRVSKGPNERKPYSRIWL